MNPQQTAPNGTIKESDLQNFANTYKQNVLDTYAQHGYFLVGGQLVKDPNYLDPLQQLQATQLGQNITGTAPANPQKIADEEASKIYADFAAQNKLPLKPQDLTNIIDPTTGKQAPNGTTQEEVNSGKYITITPEERSARDAIAQAENVINQVKQASSAVNTNTSATGGLSIPQHIKAIILHANGDPNANFLDKQVAGILGPITSSLLSVNRFNGNEIANLTNNIPKATDSKQQAQAKLQRLDNFLNTAKQSVGFTAGSPTNAPSATQGTQIDPLGLR